MSVLAGVDPGAAAARVPVIEDGTIAAVATPPGRGGLGIVRISGPEVEKIGAAVFRPSRPRPRLPHARALYGTALGPGGEPLDRGFLTFFRRPRSYTGEDTAEITLHGSPYLLGRLLEAAMEAGARAAEPGEFTYRAFRNRRLDLTQAEAVADLIAARTGHQARVAFQQAEGRLAQRLAAPREGLLDLVAHLEAALEFSEEDGVGIGRDEVLGRLDAIAKPLEVLIGSYARGRLLRAGATLVLAGAPNVGKSSLFNRLLGQPRAIVTSVPGTTRDLVSEPVEIDGIPFRLVDTAGDDGTVDPVAAAADPPDPIVAEGVRRGIEARRDADQVLLVLDGSRPLSPDDRRLLEAVAPGSVIAINKRDLPPAVDAAVVRRDAPERQVVEISALTGEGIDRLLRSLASSLPAGESGGDVPVTRRRQHDELRRCHEAIRRGRVSAREGHGEELILADLEAAVGALGRLTGELELEQVYDRIFSTFCIGK